MTRIPLNFQPHCSPSHEQLMELADALVNEVYIPRKFQGDMETIVQLLRDVYDAGRSRGLYEALGGER